MIFGFVAVCATEMKGRMPTAKEASVTILSKPLEFIIQQQFICIITLHTSTLLLPFRASISIEKRLENKSFPRQGINPE
jgi:hypothetical protein